MGKSPVFPVPPGLSFQDYRAFGPRWGGRCDGCLSGKCALAKSDQRPGENQFRRGSGENEQRELLEAEGVIFDDRDRVDLKRYGWEGPQA